MNFIDKVLVDVKAGDGGNGALSFRKEKFVDRGGPDGGDGGRGGHIILEGSSQLWTLLHLQYRKHLFAQDGEGGGGNLRSGAQGEDIVIQVPLGTVARDAETGEMKLEITQDGQRAAKNGSC